MVTKTRGRGKGRGATQTRPRDTYKVQKRVSSAIAVVRVGTGIEKLLHTVGVLVLLLDGFHGGNG